MTFSFGFLLLIGFFKTRSGGLWWPLLIKMMRNALRPVGIAARTFGDLGDPSLET